MTELLATIGMLIGNLVAMTAALIVPPFELILAVAVLVIRAAAVPVTIAALLTIALPATLFDIAARIGQSIYTGMVNFPRVPERALATVSAVVEKTDVDAWMRVPQPRKLRDPD